MRPSVGAPTGTLIGRPVSTTRVPLVPRHGLSRRHFLHVAGAGTAALATGSSTLTQAANLLARPAASPRRGGELRLGIRDLRLRALQIGLGARALLMGRGKVLFGCSQLAAGAGEVVPRLSHLRLRLRHLPRLHRRRLAGTDRTTGGGVAGGMSRAWSAIAQGGQRPPA